MSQHQDPPQTPEAAIAQGYKPIADIDRYIREKLGISEAELQRRQHEFAQFRLVGVNCADPANLGQVCRRDDGLGIICYCGPNKNCNCLGR